MRTYYTVLTIIVLNITALTAQLSVSQLLCEQKTNPIGIDDKLPRFSWQLGSDKRNTRQIAYEIRVARSLDDLNKNKNLVWSTGKVESDASVFIDYKGSPLESGKRYFWQVRAWDNHGNTSAWSNPAFWQMGFLNTTDWKAQWIEQGFAEEATRPSPLFRKSFLIKKKIASATAYITARGLYEAHINGQRVGDAYLTPGWTVYPKRLQYQVFDVTHLVKTGDNAIGIALGNGWYRGYIGWADKNNFYGKDIALLCQLDIQYTDGSKESIFTDGTWKSSTGAIRTSEIYHGETIDARLDKTGWATPQYDDRSWSGVTVKDYPKNTLIATYNELIKKHETFKPVKILTTPKGETVIDYGQNLVGWVIVKARGNAGDSLTIQHAEVLDKEGNFYTANLRAAKSQDTYILRGGGADEIFEPHFTFHGFRYIKIIGLKGQPRAEDFTAVALYSAMPTAGQFTSSHPLINQLQSNIQWGQKGNFLDVPTDCPQRDERMGWTGDAQAFSRTATFNMNVHNFFAKWLKDVAADQLPNGSVPFVVPNVLQPNAAGSTGWADVATIAPWNMYLAYGDRRILTDQYPSMKAWVDYMTAQSKNDLWNTGFHFGDWLFYDVDDDREGKSAVTDKYLIAQCFYAHSTQLLINTARVLNKNDDEKAYTDLLNRIKLAFQKEYVTPNGRLVSGTQTAYTLALHFDMLPENLRLQAAERLAQNVKSYNYHITTGFLGTPYICHVLSRYGYDSIAYKLLLQDSYPSWLYPVKMGATTIWERWDGIKPDGSFQTPTMNSYNHYAYGAIGDWLYRIVAGIDTDEKAVGYKHICIKPHLGGDFKNAAATLQTYYGKAASKWSVTEGGTLTLDVEIPHNTTATIYIPAQNAADVQESDVPLSALKDAQILPPTEGGVSGGKGYVAVKVGSGKYRFLSRGW